jgi:hypothetical protein
LTAAATAVAVIAVLVAEEEEEVLHFSKGDKKKDAANMHRSKITAQSKNKYKQTYK